MLAETQALDAGRQGIRSHTRSTHTASLPRTSTRSDLNISHSLGDGTRVPSPSAKLAVHTGRLKLLLPRSSSSQNQVSYFSVKTREGEKRFRLFTTLWEFWGSQRKLSQLGRALCSQLFIFPIFFFLPCPRNRKNTFAQPAAQKRSQQRIYFFQPGLYHGLERITLQGFYPKTTRTCWGFGDSPSKPRGSGCCQFGLLGKALNCRRPARAS